MTNEELKKAIDKIGFKPMPRNLERIPELLAELEKVWRKCPDMRFGQLVNCIVINESVRFNMEDDEMIEAIKDFGSKLIVK